MNTLKHNNCTKSTYFVVNRNLTNKSLYACMHAACPRFTGLCTMQKNFHAIMQTCYLDNLQTGSMKLCGVGSMEVWKY